MPARFEIPDWSSLARRDDAALPLLATALLIARDEYPDLDADLYDTLAQEHAAGMRAQVEAIDHWALKMQAINRRLFDELGYAGARDGYYDPRNSYINQVFERRIGNPISLAMVQMEVARRLGVPLDGISFPGHFLVRLPIDDGVLVMDPFNRGRPLRADELRQRARPHLGGDVPDDDQLAQILHPASHRAILARVLRNLHGVYVEAGDWERATRSADRLLKLSPNDPDALRERGLGYLHLGHHRGARSDLSSYLRLNPRAADARQVRARLLEIGRSAGHLH